MISLESHLEGGTAAATCIPPACVFVTGPRGSGKTRWIQQCIGAIRSRDSATACALLLAEEGRTRMERFAAEVPGVTMRKFSLPCLCCPAAADFPSEVRRLSEANRPNFIFVELPALAAAGLIAEFDRCLRWKRTVVVCFDPVRTGERSRSYFESRLADVADAIVVDSASATVAQEWVLRVAPAGDLPS